MESVTTELQQQLEMVTDSTRALSILRQLLDDQCAFDGLTSAGTVDVVSSVALVLKKVENPSRVIRKACYHIAKVALATADRVEAVQPLCSFLRQDLQTADADMLQHVFRFLLSIPFNMLELVLFGDSKRSYLDVIRRLALASPESILRRYAFEVMGSLVSNEFAGRASGTGYFAHVFDAITSAVTNQQIESYAWCAALRCFEPLLATELVTHQSRLLFSSNSEYSRRHIDVRSLQTVRRCIRPHSQVRDDDVKKLMAWIRSGSHALDIIQRFGFLPSDLVPRHAPVLTLLVDMWISLELYELTEDTPTSLSLILDNGLHQHMYVINDLVNNVLLQFLIDSNHRVRTSVGQCVFYLHDRYQPDNVTWTLAVVQSWLPLLAADVEEIGHMEINEVVVLLCTHLQDFHEELLYPLTTRLLRRLLEDETSSSEQENTEAEIRRRRSCLALCIDAFVASSLEVRRRRLLYNARAYDLSMVRSKSGRRLAKAASTDLAQAAHRRTMSFFTDFEVENSQSAFSLQKRANAEDGDELVDPLELLFNEPFFSEMWHAKLDPASPKSNIRVCLVLLLLQSIVERCPIEPTARVVVELQDHLRYDLQAWIVVTLGMVQLCRPCLEWSVSASGNEGFSVDGSSTAQTSLHHLSYLQVLSRTARMLYDQPKYMDMFDEDTLCTFRRSFDEWLTALAVLVPKLTHFPDTQLCALGILVHYYDLSSTNEVHVEKVLRTLGSLLTNMSNVDVGELDESRFDVCLMSWLTAAYREPRLLTRVRDFLEGIREKRTSLLSGDCDRRATHCITVALSRLHLITICREGGSSNRSPVSHQLLQALFRPVDADHSMFSGLLDTSIDRALRYSVLDRCRILFDQVEFNKHSSYIFGGFTQYLHRLQQQIDLDDHQMRAVLNATGKHKAADAAEATLFSASTIGLLEKPETVNGEGPGEEPAVGGGIGRVDSGVHKDIIDFGKVTGYSLMEFEDNCSGCGLAYGLDEGETAMMFLSGSSDMCHIEASYRVSRVDSSVTVDVRVYNQAPFALENVRLNVDPVGPMTLVDRDRGLSHTWSEIKPRAMMEIQYVFLMDMWDDNGIFFSLESQRKKPGTNMIAVTDLHSQTELRIAMKDVLDPMPLDSLAMYNRLWASPAFTCVTIVVLVPLSNLQVALASSPTKAAARVLQQAIDPSVFERAFDSFVETESVYQACFAGMTWFEDPILLSVCACPAPSSSSCVETMREKLANNALHVYACRLEFRSKPSILKHIPRTIAAACSRSPSIVVYDPRDDAGVVDGIFSSASGSNGRSSRPSEDSVAAEDMIQHFALQKWKESRRNVEHAIPLVPSCTPVEAPAERHEAHLDAPRESLSAASTAVHNDANWLDNLPTFSDVKEKSSATAQRAPSVQISSAPEESAPPPATATSTGDSSDSARNSSDFGTRALSSQKAQTPANRSHRRIASVDFFDLLSR